MKTYIRVEVTAPEGTQLEIRDEILHTLKNNPNVTFCKVDFVTPSITPSITKSITPTASEVQSEFFVDQIVKYKEPAAGEEEYTFIVKEIHEAGEQKEKIRIELICDDHLKPQWVHFSDQYIKA